MPLTLELAQTVAIGAFNPYVITPEWLVRVGIAPREDELQVRLVAISQGSAFRLGLADWMVDNQRLSVAHQNQFVDSGQIVSSVLHLLPHTPVQAVGNNFHFTAAREDWGSRPVPSLGKNTLDTIDGAEQLRWVAVFKRDEVRIEATVAYERTAVAIMFNHHRVIEHDELNWANLAKAQIDPAEIAAHQIAPARIAAGKCRDDYELSRTLLKTFFDMELPQ